MKNRKETPISESEGFGISGFTLGILSIVLAGWLGAVTGITGFIFCRIQQRKNPIKIARIGSILNIIGFVISVALLLVTYFYLLPLISQ